MNQASTRTPTVWSLIVLMVFGSMLTGCCTHKGRAADHKDGESITTSLSRVARHLQFEYTTGFVRDRYGNYDTSGDPGPILAAMRPRHGESTRTGKLRGGASSELEAADTSDSMEPMYVILTGDHSQCGYPGALSVWWEYVRGLWWPRQRTEWVDATNDATEIIIQIVHMPNGDEIHRVFLLWDGRTVGPDMPPSKVTVTLLATSQQIILTCGTLAEECYTQTVNGGPLSEPQLLHPGDNPTPLELFVDCIKNIAAGANIPEALPPKSE